MNRLTTLEYVVLAIDHPETFPTWRLELLASEANWLGMYEEESWLRAQVKERMHREGRYAFEVLRGPENIGPVAMPEVGGFELTREQATREGGKRETFATEKMRQRKLIDGLDCLPGQMDLF